MKLPKLRYGVVPLATLLILGIVLVLIYLTVVYLGPSKGLDHFGLIGQKKAQEQSSEAAKGGNGGGAGKGGKTTVAPCTLTATPNQVKTGTDFLLTGTGFTPGTQLNIQYDGVTHWIWTSDCTISLYIGAGFAGTGKLIVALELANNSWVKCGSTTIDVLAV